VLANHFPGGGSLERPNAGQHLVEDTAQGVDVGAGIHRTSLGLLWGHVIGGTQDHAGSSHVGQLGGPGDTEVGNFPMPMASEMCSSFSPFGNVLRMLSLVLLHTVIHRFHKLKPALPLAYLKEIAEEERAL